MNFTRCLAGIALFLLGAGCVPGSTVSCDWTKGMLLDFRTGKCADSSKMTPEDVKLLDGDEQLTRAMKAGYERSEVRIHFAFNKDGYFDTSVQRMMELLKDDPEAKLSIVGYYLPTANNMRIPIHYPGVDGQTLLLKDVEGSGIEALRARGDELSELGSTSFKGSAEAIEQKDILVEAVYGEFNLRNLQRVFRDNSKEFSRIQLGDELFMKLYFKGVK